jgi:hypothetical protein
MLARQVPWVFDGQFAALTGNAAEHRPNTSGTCEGGKSCAEVEVGEEDSRGRAHNRRFAPRLNAPDIAIGAERYRSCDSGSLIRGRTVVTHVRPRQLAIIVVVATIGLIGFGGMALGSANATRLNSFALSGQISVTLPLDRTAQCVAGNSTHTGGIYTSRVFLAGQHAKPSGALWALIIETTHTGTTKLPGHYPVAAALSISRGGSNQYAWTSTATTGSGTVTLTGDAKQGSIDVVLEPTPGSGGAAKRAEHVVGSWKC